MSRHEATGGNGESEQAGKHEVAPRLDYGPLVPTGSPDDVDPVIKATLDEPPVLYDDAHLKEVLHRENERLTRQRTEMDRKQRARVLRYAGTLAAGLALGGVIGFGLGNSDQQRMPSVITEHIPPEAGVFIPAANRDAMDADPVLKDVPLTPLAIWCEPGAPNQKGTLHIDPVISPVEALPNPRPEDPYCAPAPGITIPSDYIAEHALVRFPGAN